MNLEREISCFEAAKFIENAFHWHFMGRFELILTFIIKIA